MNTWKLLARKKVFASRFVNVYEDRVELPNGKIIDDFTVVEKPSIVMIVATDTNNNVLILNEYKHGAGAILKTLPAGHKEKSETAVEAAAREVAEETGYTGGEYEDLGVLYDYPSKDIHKVHVVRARNIALTTLPQHEETESIQFEVISPKDLKTQIRSGNWHAGSAIAALTISGVLF
jgi:8-oxo-dGTP pyrophosphatase MutT (NUDIX family)